MRQRKRITALLMAGLMVFTNLPVNALAVEKTETGGLCEHHPEHTAECGYTEGVDGTPCNHQHKGNGGEADSEGCYVLVTECVHEHMAECYPQESGSDDTASPPNADEVQPTECTHECSEENGCITEQLDCKHEHNSECGYVPAVEGTPCTFVCEECNGESSEQEKDQCSCDAPCTEDAINIDCPVCSVDGADLTACKGGVEEIQQITITEFDPLDEEVANQIISAEKKLNLPDTLGASGYVGTQDSGGAEHLTIEGVTWEPDQPYDENAEQGAWLFTAVLPEEGYTLAEGVSLPEISVMVEPVNLLAGEADVSTGDVVINDTCDENCNHRIIGTSTQYTIKVTGGEHNITIADVDINVSGCAFSIENGANVNLTLEGKNTLQSGRHSAGLQVPEGATLTLNGAEGASLTVQGGEAGAGIGGGNRNKGGTITISSGNIRVTGGRWAAAIGGGDNSDGSGDIKIEGGKITLATSENNKGGCLGYADDENAKGGSVSITGGTLESQANPAVKSNDVSISDCVFTILEGDTSLTPEKVQDSLVFSGNTIAVYGKFTLDTDLTINQEQTLVIQKGAEYAIGPNVTLTNNGTVQNEGILSIFDTGQIQNGGLIYNWGEISGAIKITSEGNIYNWGEISGSGTIHNNGFIYDGGTIANTVSISGNGTVKKGVFEEDISNGPVEIGELCDNACPGHIITGTNQQIDRAIIVTEGKHKITLVNVNISAASAFKLQEGVEVELTLVGNNILKSSGKGEAGFGVQSGAILTVLCGAHRGGLCPANGEDCGRLKASGAYDAAGIGCSSYENGGNIVISGGIINAIGGFQGAGIGGAYMADCGSIYITGGTVNASGGPGASGIGGGWDGNGGNVTITGGIVTANAGSANTGIFGADIGKAGSLSSQPPSGSIVTISGGSVKAATIDNNPRNENKRVYLGIVPAIQNVSDVSVDGVPYYVPGNHEGDNQLYIYMTPASTHTVTIRDNTGKVTTYGNVPYVEGGIDGDGENKGYFDFARVTPTDNKPTKTSDVSFLQTEYEANFGQANEVSLSIQVENPMALSRFAAMDSLHITVTPKDSTASAVGFSYPVIAGAGSYELDISKLDAGTYALAAWYGGSKSSQPPTDAATAILKITPANIGKAKVRLLREEGSYNGQSHKYEMVAAVELNGKTLQRNIDYTISFTRNEEETSDLTSAGEITVVVTGKGNYADVNGEIFTIQPKVVTPILTYATTTKEYDGTTTAPAGMGIKLDGILNGDDVSATAEFAYNNANVKDAKTITAKNIALIGAKEGNYQLSETQLSISGTITKSTPDGPAVPTKAEATDISITLNTILGAEYKRDNGNWQDSPVFEGLNRNTAYTFYARIKETDNTKPSLESSASISTDKTSLNGVQITVTGTYIYDGTSQTPTVEVTYNNNPIGSDQYIVSATDNINASENAIVTVTATQDSNFSGEASENFTITQAPLVIRNVILDNKIYDGTVDGKVANVSFDGMIPGETLTLGTDYTASAKFDDADAGTGKTVQVTIDWKETEKTKNYLLSVTDYLLPNQTIGQADAPQINWPAATGLTYGQPLSESTLSGGSTTYGSFEWKEPDQVPTAGDSGSYPVIFTPNEHTEKNYEPVTPNPRNVTVIVNQAKPTLTLTPSTTEQKGGGEVILTLAGLPADGTATISSSVDSVTPTETENGVWKVNLPNKDETYTFTASYAGDENHEPAAADCTVTVQRRSSSSGGSGSSGSARPTGGTETGSVTPVTENGKQMVTVTITKQKLDDLVERNVDRYEVNSGVLDFGFSRGALQQLNNVSGQGDIVLKAVQAANPAGGGRPAWDMTLVYRLNGVDTPITLDGSKTVSVKLPYTPAAGEQSALIYAITTDSAGKIIWRESSSYDPDQKSVLFSITDAGTYGVGYQTKVPAFTDISGHWAKDHILFVTSRGLLAGTSNNRFSPDTGITQGMFVLSLERLAAMNGKSYKADAAIFPPDAAMTRETLAMMLKDYADKMGYALPATLEAVTFTDNGSIRAEAKTAVQAMQRAGILTGKDGNRFDPKGMATRGEVAAALHRFVEIVIDPQAANGWKENASGTRSYYKSGKSAVGWMYDGNWYWLEKGGIPFTGGWKQLAGKWYYLNADGTMAADTVIDGYTIGPDGARK